MRIIAGEARGRRLFAPDGLDTRPTSDRTRESLFNILGARVAGARVLDLFAGSGALALEALSRGAAFAALCDNSRRALPVLRRNIELCGWQDRTRVFACDYMQAIAQSSNAYSLVFLDPPYRMTDVYAKAASALKARHLLAQEALLVMEHASNVALALPDGFVIVDERRYRDTAITMFACGENAR